MVVHETIQIRRNVKKTESVDKGSKFPGKRWKDSIKT
jgi:hypothetical protein